MTEYSVSRDTTISADAAGNLIDKYKKRTKFKAWLKSYTDRVQEGETDAQDLIDILNIDDATGVFLDVLGAIVGQKRTDVDDEVYRISVKARIRINISHGTEDDIQELAFLLFAATTDWFTRDVYPNEIRLNVNDSASGTENTIAALIKQACAAAKRFRLEYSAESRVNMFTLRHFDTPNSPSKSGKLAGLVTT